MQFCHKIKFPVKQRHCTEIYSLSINNVKLSITNGKTSPPYHPVCGCNTPPEDKQLKDQDHARANVRSGWTYCKHTLVNLETESSDECDYW